MPQGDILEDPVNEPAKDMFVMSVNPEDAPNTPEYVFHIAHLSGYLMNRDLVAFAHFC